MSDSVKTKPVNQLGVHEPQFFVVKMNFTIVLIIVKKYCALFLKKLT